MVLALMVVACGGARQPRPTILNVTPPPPPPEPDEARLMPAELRPDASEPIETAPGSSLESAARRAMDAVQSEVIRCYEAVLVADAHAAGRFEVQLDLRADGTTSRVHLDHAGQGVEAMVPCLRDLFTTLRVRDVSPHGRYVTRVYAFAIVGVQLQGRTAVLDVTQREVQSNPNVAAINSPLRGPGYVAPIGVGGHFPPNVAFTHLDGTQASIGALRGKRIATHTNATRISAPIGQIPYFMIQAG